MCLEDLNDNQRKAVTYCDGPSLVIAGAGSGKTRVLTYKIAYLLQQGLKPWNILALTFTNKAANEMKQRISKLVDNANTSYLWMGTFHSIFSRILRAEASEIGYSSDFTIYDALDSKNLIKRIIKDMGLDEKKYKSSTIASYISMAKNHLILPDAYRQNVDFVRRDRAQNISATHDIYTRYMTHCKRSNVMDFDDLLLNTWLLFTNHPDIKSKYQQRFDYVLVDEYQDTNYAQHQIVTLLTNENQHLCVVGDDAQSIYSFRGANIDNILNFPNSYRSAKLFKLEENYRSTQTIVGAANSLIRHNRSQIQKEVFSQREVGTPIELCKAFSDVDEANIVVRQILKYNKREHVDFKNIAILYRTNAQSRSLEEALRKERIPYRIYGGLSFYQRKEIKDLIAYFRLSINPYDEEALRRVINYPVRGIGDVTLNMIFKKADELQMSAWDVLSNIELLDVNKGIQTKLKKFTDIFQVFFSYVKELNAFQAGLRIVEESGILADVNKSVDAESSSRKENLQELLNGIANFVELNTEKGEGVSMKHYLQEVSLISDLDDEVDVSDNKVNLMTVHTAKGLEYETVIVVGMEESLFPSQMSMDNPRQLEEERRLFYVAMTRAERFLVLVYSKSRMRFGRFESLPPSRFLKEIDSRYFAKVESSPSVAKLNVQSSFLESFNKHFKSSHSPIGFAKISTNKTESSSASMSSPSSLDNLKVGSRVCHERFGEGLVRSLTGEGLDAKATVLFDNAGLKQLLLRFAKLTVIG